MGQHKRYFFKCSHNASKTQYQQGVEMVAVADAGTNLIDGHAVEIATGLRHDLPHLYLAG